MKSRGSINVRRLPVVIVSLIAMLCLMSCGESKNERRQRELIDSLTNVSAQQRMDYEDLSSYLTVISEGLDSISMEENEIFLNKTPGENLGINRQKMKQQLSHVRELLARHRERIDELEKKLGSNTAEAKKLQTIITALKEQLDQKDKELAQLRADLDDSRKSISALNDRLKSMQSAQTEQLTKIEEQEATINSQTDKLNQAYIRLGSKSELKKLGLLKRSKVNYSDVDISLFDAVDRREVTSISVSKRAKILTPVPADSYVISDGTLTIVDIKKFWSLSNILIIQTD